MRLPLAATAVLAFFSLSAAGQQITTAAQLVNAMHDRYAGKWYRTLTFEQQSITHKPDGTDSTELWHESLLLPGRLRIDIAETSSGNGMIFVNNHLYIFRDGKPAGDRELIHPLMVLGFDIYLQPAETTMQQLQGLKFDLSLFHEDTLDGRPAYVVGAKAGDVTARQFWIDKERLYFVRLLGPSQRDPKVVEDVRFGDYKQVEGGAWLSEHVTIHADGKLVFEEKYSDVKLNPPLAEGLFDPKQFAAKAEPAKP